MQMKKATMILFLAVFFVFQNTIAFADNAETNAIIAISTADELSSITKSGSFYLKNDIDLEGFEWKGIRDFNGMLNGNGHAIQNMKSDCGLFKKLSSGAVVKNIRLENTAIISKDKMLGGIVSYVPAKSQNVTIQNCSVSGVVYTAYSNPDSNLNFCGSIAGVVASKSCSVINCSSYADVEAVMCEGGIVGLNYGKIIGSFFTGKVGCAQNSSQYYYPESSDINDIYNLSLSSGGIAAVNYGEIEECAVLINNADCAVYFGTICGINIKNIGKITDCFKPQFPDFSSLENEHYDKVANVISRKTYSTALAHF